MDIANWTTPTAGDSRQRRRGFKPGDLVVPASGYPVLCEVVSADTGGLVRIRGLDWSPGFTVLVRVEDYRLVTGQLSS
jgi:hypothetical protein